MAVIQELSPHLADLIAAGEVVERPSSVAKELIENAIDAGAKQITAEIENGGITYLRIADNGCGMSDQDAPIAFRRHATSKLRTEQGLTAIGTLGFRGEALAAISAVSHIDLFTRQKDSIAGLHLHLDAGTVTEKEEAGCPVGTTLVIRDLFYNTPARMKFLKKDFTEAGYVLGVIQHAALSHPEISFTLIRDGKQVFATDGKGKLLMPVFAVFGKEFTENLLEIKSYEHEGIRVYGFIAKPHAGRPNRSMQHFFVNKRYVKNRLMQAALEEAYRNAIITGKYPSCALFLDIPLSTVDVNVHPAKTEVKFSHEKQIFEAIYIACKNALAAGDNTPKILAHETEKAPREDHITANQQRFAVPQKPLSIAKDPDDEPLEDFLVSVPPKAEPFRQMASGFRPQGDAAASPIEYRSSMQRGPQTADPTLINELLQATDLPRAVPVSPPTANKTASEAAPLQPLNEGARVLGECFHTYLVAEDKDGLILIDKHAAHERLLFNELRRSADIPQQQLLTPVVVELSGEEAAAVTGGLAAITAAGFAIEPFGNNSFAVRSAPAYLDSSDIPAVLSELAEKLSSNRKAVPDALDDLIHTVACKAAIKAGKATTLTEMQDLCDRVLSDPDVRSCPHGRPTTVRLTKYELDKLFKRVNQ